MKRHSRSLARLTQCKSIPSRRYKPFGYVITAPVEIVPVLLLNPIGGGAAVGLLWCGFTNAFQPSAPITAINVAGLT